MTSAFDLSAATTEELVAALAARHLAVFVTYVGVDFKGQALVGFRDETAKGLLSSWVRTFLKERGM